MSDCCSSKNKIEALHLVILGGGSAAFAAAIKAGELGARVTLINTGLPIGGTCVNVGCVPSKTLIRAAETLYRATHHHFTGIETCGKVSDFGAVMQQKQELVEELRQAKYLDVIFHLTGIRILEGRGKILAGKVVEVGGERIQADRILIATGAKPHIPSIPGLKGIDFLTNESAFALDELPESLIVFGGRYIALECAQMFARLGSKVTILQRSARILPTESEDLTHTLTGFLEEEGIRVVTDVKMRNIAQETGGVVAKVDVGGEERDFHASRLLVTTGREPNLQGIGVEDLYVALNSNGFLQVDEHLQTNIEGIFGAGDVVEEPMFVYTAAYEGALAAENAIQGRGRERDYTALPWVIFTDPQVAGVGLDDKQALKEGVEAESTTLPMTHVPRALAARDTRGFIKLIRERETDRLVGARILAPEGSELLMEISLAIKYGITVKDLAGSFHPYLTLSEAVKLAALSFGKDVSRLSCCAT